MCSGLKTAIVRLKSDIKEKADRTRKARKAKEEAESDTVERARAWAKSKEK